MSNFSIAGNCAISGSLTVGSTTALSALLTSMSSGTFVTGIITSTIAASNNITQNAGSISSGSGGMACNGTLSVLGTSEFESDATFDGNIKLNGNIVSNSLNISPIEISYLDGGTQNINTALTTVQSKTANITTAGSITIPAGQSITMVGLNNVDNTTDAAKPVSTAQNTALALKATLASPTFTGTVAGITKAMVGLGNVDNTTDVNKPVSTAQKYRNSFKSRQTQSNF